ncbi:MAG: DNA glycosylase AlkZ-like family protein, partial [Ruthenibacterium sp.]
MAQLPVVGCAGWRAATARARTTWPPRAAGPLEAAAACGLQNSPPGAFETALFARVQGASPAGIRRALYEEKSLLQAWSLRGAPAVFPTRDSDVFLCALQGAHSEQPWVYTRGIGLALGRLSMTVQQLWPLVRGAAQQCLGRQAIVGKPALDAAVAALVLPQLPVEKQPVWNSPRPMASRRRRWAGCRFLRPCAFERLVVFGRRQGALPVFTSPEAWLGAPLPPPRPDAALRLARRFVHCYGPTTPAAFQSWLGASPAQARRMWAAVAPETRPVSLAGRTAYVLAQDMP